MPKTLSTLWLIVVLALAPLSAPSFADVVDADACPMHEPADTDGGGMNDCPQCNNHECGTGGCNHQGCTATVQLAFPVSHLSLPSGSTNRPAITFVTRHPSLAAPPLLRPPV